MRSKILSAAAFFSQRRGFGVAFAVFVGVTVLLAVSVCVVVSLPIDATLTGAPHSPQKRSSFDRGAPQRVQLAALGATT